MSDSRRKYNSEIDVYEASQERLKFIFDNFPRIYVSFSGGKDSGVMLNLVIDYMRKHGITRKIGVMTMDNECNYEHSLSFMHDILGRNRDILDIYWCCLPLTLPCTVSAYQVDWQCWGQADEKRWVRPMPKKDYVVHMGNAPFDFVRPNMLDKDFYDNFAEWYAQEERCARNGEYAYNCYPLYDWKTEDIWTANAKFDWSYNSLYDIFYKAGIPVHKMRVASPFMSESKSSLAMYRVIDPACWARLCARVHGANFIATYGKQLGYKSIKLPPGHTWKSFVKFLLATLPKEVAENFRRRFVQSFKVWGRTGRGLPQRIIQELEENNIPFSLNGKTRHGRQDLDRVIIRKFPDELDALSCSNGTVASWKRFAITILKNDHTCKYMGLAPTKEQAERQRTIQKKYKRL